MELISQHAKKIMEECKSRARDAGLSFDDESLEYIVTNQDMLELSPKVMIPTLYDFWVHDLELIKGKKEYELYPHNPYETVINSRPAISFYNDNNPDWLNVMIFYHVLGHIDFFQNNSYFEHTWDDDFVGLALSDKRLLSQLKTEHGRWVDYVIEFSRSLDNLVGYFSELSNLHLKKDKKSKFDYYFDLFLQHEKKVETPEYLKDLEEYNQCLLNPERNAKKIFLQHVKLKFPEFEAAYKKYKETESKPKKDLLTYIHDHSPILAQEKNSWMKSVIQIIRNTALYFAPQMRTKVMNEGWASYWHQELFLKDSRIEGYEANFAKINAYVTSIPKVGFNPYAIGLRLFEHIEKEANQGKLDLEFEHVLDREDRKHYNKKTGKGRAFMFSLREKFTDFTFLNTYITQDFVDAHKLSVIGERFNPSKMVREYYIKSKQAVDYKNMLLDRLVHPPSIEVEINKTSEDRLYLKHIFEGKPLVEEYIQNVMIGLEFLWGNPVTLETIRSVKGKPISYLYTIQNKELVKNEFHQKNESVSQ
jgi:stage V sporulation protein R